MMNPRRGLSGLNTVTSSSSAVTPVQQQRVAGGVFTASAGSREHIEMSVV
jgi:hypothetical protein